MRRRVMHVGREPDSITDAHALDEGQDVSELELAAARRPVVALTDRLESLAILIISPQ
jgi:hypothetical protein